MKKQQLLSGLAVMGLSMAAPLAAQAYPITAPPSDYRTSGTPVEGRFCYATLTDTLYYCYDRALNPNRVSRTFGPNAIVIGPEGEQYERNGFYSSEYRESIYYGASPRTVSPTAN